MKRFTASPPLLFGLGFAALFVVWLVYVGLALYPTFRLPPVDTSAPFLMTRNDETLLVETAPDGTQTTTRRTIGPVVPWNDGLVYWDSTKPCLFIVRAGQKPKSVYLHPSRLISAASLVPVKGGVYINSRGTKNEVVFVHLPDGASQIRGEMKAVRGSQNSAAIAYQTPRDTFVVRDRDGRTRTVPLQGASNVYSWDYDPVRDALVWLDGDLLFYRSKADSWKKRVGYEHQAVGFSGTNGDMWLQKSRSSGGEIWMRTALGQERGLRWRSQERIYVDTGDFIELTREQADLIRALPDRK